MEMLNTVARIMTSLQIHHQKPNDTNCRQILNSFNKYMLATQNVRIYSQKGFQTITIAWILLIDIIFVICFRFIAILCRRYRKVQHMPCPTPAQPPPLQHPHNIGYSDDPALTHGHPKSIDCTRVHPWSCILFQADLQWHVFTIIVASRVVYCLKKSTMLCLFLPSSSLALGTCCLSYCLPFLFEGVIYLES